MSSTAPLRTIRQANTRRIIEALNVHGEMSRAELCRITNLSRTTTHRILHDLAAQGAVMERIPEGRKTTGRPEGLLSVNPGTGVVIGIELGRSQMAVAVLNYAGSVVWAKELRLDAPLSWDVARDTLLGLLDGQAVGVVDLRLGLLGAHGLMPSSASYVGSDERDRRLVELGTLLSERLTVPIGVHSNTRLAAVAEFRGRGLRDENLIYCHLSRGIGSALVLGGHIMPGSTNSAGEFGHMRMVEDGRPCHCGSSGCVETVVGMDALLLEARSRNSDVRDFDHLCQLAQSQGPLHRLAADAAAHLGHAIGNVCNVVNPAYVVLGGELIRLLPDWVERVSRAVGETALPQVYEGLQVSESMHGRKAASYGAGLLALDVVLGRVDDIDGQVVNMSATV